MVQLYPHILGHGLHLRLKIVLHSTTKVQELPHFGEVEEDIAREEYNTEEQVATIVPNLLN
jgi:hypothetical protein